DNAKSWYNFSEGLDSLIGDLLAQIVISGAISREIVPNNDLSGVKKVVAVHPKDIVFKYNPKSDEHEPYQKIKGVLTGSVNNLNKLNPFTYKYYAIRRFNENPLAVPPFLTAIENTVIEKDLLCSLKHTAKNIGVLGFLSVLVNAPKKLPGDSDEVYQGKCMKYLNSVVPEIEKG